MQREFMLQLGVDRHGALTRRRLLQWGAAGMGVSSLFGSMGLHAEEVKEKQRACILVWLAGGPSQFETWDPKPGTENGGPTEAIATGVSGVRIAEHWPKTAQMMKHLAIIRSMTNREGNHERATYHLHTGRPPLGGLKHPSLGSVVANELGEYPSDLPNFVSVGPTIGAGFLGVQAAPFVVARPGGPPANVASTVPAERMNRRLALLRDQDGDFARSGVEDLATEHQGLYEQAARMALTPKLSAFRLAQEPKPVRDAYGSSAFGQGLLLARRLVEVGVPFVEVRRTGWDTHQDVFERVPNLAAEVDPAFAQLIADLDQRGMLENTLVICMGEFGRTPKINARTGRDHWPGTFGAVLAGGGVQGGQVIGSTTADGTAVKDRPVAVADLFQSYCHAMRIDADDEYITPQGRPLRIVDGGSVVDELFG